MNDRELRKSRVSPRTDSVADRASAMGFGGGPLLPIEPRVRRWLSQFSPGRRRLERSFRSLRARFYDELWADTARRLGGHCEELGAGYLRVKLGSRHTLVRGGEVMLDSHLLWELAGNKPLCHRLLQPVPGYQAARYQTFTLGTFSLARTFLRELAGPAVVKPADGPGAGRGITTGIETLRELRQASEYAARFGAELMIEEQVLGSSYRLLFLGGQLLQALRRDPPSVAGDGRHSIGELMGRQTAQRLLPPEITALSPLDVDLEARYCLHKQGLRLDHIPEDGQRVVVKSVSNQNSARENHVVEDLVHPSFVSLGRAITQALSIELMGLDILAPTLREPLEQSRGRVGEINTTPGLHHHYLISERRETVDVAERVLEYAMARAVSSRLEEGP